VLVTGEQYKASHDDVQQAVPQYWKYHEKLFCNINYVSSKVEEILFCHLGGNFDQIFLLIS